MVSRSGNSVISFNGEIYNFQELADELETSGRPVDRRFDTSILIEALEHWGTAVLPRLNGMFAFVWYRPREDRLLLGRDRWGKKPLFWGRVPIRGKETLVIASELRIFAPATGRTAGSRPSRHRALPRLRRNAGLKDGLSRGREGTGRGVGGARLERAPLCSW